jgi:hypothetical protein
VTWEYFAGFLDGDGWITGSRNRNCRTIKYTVGVTQLLSQKPAMMMLAQFLEAQGVAVQIVERISEGILKTKTPMIDIRICEQASLVFILQKIIPHLLMKRDKAEACLRDLQIRREHRAVDVECRAAQPTNVYWTQHDIDSLLALHDAGFGNRAIAARLERSVDSVSKKLHRLQIRRS